MSDDQKRLDGVERLEDGERSDAEGGGAPEQRGMSRRRVLKVLAATAAAPAVLGGCGSEAGTGAAASGAGGVAGSAGGSASGGPDERPGANYVGNPKARGDAWDPDLVKPVVRWEMKLEEDELATLEALCDVIIPADDVSPGAGELGCQNYIDEWVSAPYGFAETDLVLVRGGVRWLDREAASRFGEGRRFRDLSGAEKTAICDDICYLPEAAPEHRMAARFFDKVRDLTATAFYTTDEGMQDLGYVGNVPLPEWLPVPDEVLRQVGLEP
jgi:hypothetical protein